MQTLSIENFGPIKRIENMPIKDFMIFIGPQASGKSTIIKLIYFFKTLYQDVEQTLFGETFNNGNPPKRDSFIFHLEQRIKEKFGQYFGSAVYLDFIFKYVIDADKDIWIHIYVSTNKGSLLINFSNTLREKFAEILDLYTAYIDKKSELAEIDNPLNTSFPKSIAVKDLNEEMTRLVQVIESEILNLFQEAERTTLFLPAGRILASLLNFPKELLFQKRWISRYNFTQEVPENAMLDVFVKELLEKIRKFKAYYHEERKRNLESAYVTSEHGKKELAYFNQLQSKILKGAYEYDEYSERIALDPSNNSFPNQKLLLEQVSSGQQEIIWLFNILYILILESKNTFLVFEEPEAHLYPTAQNDIVKVLSIFLALNKGSQIAITTHSPYILTAVNNMLLASKISKAKDEYDVHMVLGHSNGITLETTSVYMMDGESGTIRSIIDEETGLIGENDLDSASNEIMDTFDKLLQLYDNQ